MNRKKLPSSVLLALACVLIVTASYFFYRQQRGHSSQNECDARFLRASYIAVRLDEIVYRKTGQFQNISRLFENEAFQEMEALIIREIFPNFEQADSPPENLSDLVSSGILKRLPTTGFRNQDFQYEKNTGASGWRIGFIIDPENGDCTPDRVTMKTFAYFDWESGLWELEKIHKDGQREKTYGKKASR